MKSQINIIILSVLLIVLLSNSVFANEQEIDDNSSCNYACNSSIQDLLNYCNVYGSNVLERCVEMAEQYHFTYDVSNCPRICTFINNYAATHTNL